MQKAWHLVLSFSFILFFRSITSLQPLLLLCFYHFLGFSSICYVIFWMSLGDGDVQQPIMYQFFLSSSYISIQLHMCVDFESDSKGHPKQNVKRKEMWTIQRSLLPWPCSKWAHLYTVIVPVQWNKISNSFRLFYLIFGCCFHMCHLLSLLIVVYFQYHLSIESRNFSTFSILFCKLKFFFTSPLCLSLPLASRFRLAIS